MNKKSTDKDILRLNEFTLKDSDGETILGITIDQKFILNKHIKNLWKKTWSKIVRTFNISLIKIKINSNLSQWSNLDRIIAF